MIVFPLRALSLSCLAILLIGAFGVGAFAAVDSDDAAPDASASDLAALQSTASVSKSSRLACSPCKVNFGRVRVGESKSIPVTLTNVGKTRVTISSKEKQARWVSPQGLTLPYTLLPGGRVKFHLVYSPLDTHRVIGHIAYHSNALNRRLPITVTAEASTAGKLAATPTSLDFGNVPVGKTVSLSQTIKNVGSAAVNIEQITDSAAGFSVGNVTVPQILAPGHSVTFTVKFDPQKTGYAAGSLVALSNASNTRLTVEESGTGTAAGTVSISPASLSFGSVPVGSSATETVTLTAKGSAITIQSDAVSSSEFSTSGLSLPLKLAAGKSVSFHVKFSPQSSGSASGTLSVKTSGPASTVKASLSGTGSGGSKHSVSLSWKPDSSSVAGYNVYRSTKSGGPYSRLTSTLETATDYLDTSVASGTTYYYEVTAVNDAGRESARSASVKAAIP